MCWPSFGNAAPEVDVGQHRDAGLGQEPLAKRFGIGAAGDPARLGDVRPRVERAAGRLARDPGHGIEQTDDEIATLEEALAHRFGGVLRARDRLDGGPLRDLRRAGVGVRDPAREHRRQRAVGDVADAPARHRPGLRCAVRNDRARLHPRPAGERIERAGVGEPRVDFVGEHPDLRMALENRRDRVEVGGAQHASRRVVRRVENEELRLRRDLRFELGRIECKFARLAQVDRDRDRAVGENLRFVDRETRGPG